ncbi:MAG: DNA repair protein RadA [Mesotoga sp.]|jgi:DNA repair protein RadA/Sms|uniref:DNA repair protein RadA n=1 Tax=unclassified Mesotoga TaxID=1184398 RepID=UPI000EF25FED|nr:MULTISPECIES: DNA repair protein RadA [unclassified Mesotoga]MDI9366850.1 DNA repair protein RadA [Thermotogota bacterium]MDD2333941.1 DNA repair protein RadA [Mesotoga sp.]MDD3680093.1 DNA repair protein RadA [Mesotoga sp.]MDD4206653.1 DNA repair protein RadA [Mesotoga sp.]MDD4824769.1 DNA repair protein RadA [Mesotoga sp.]
MKKKRSYVCDVCGYESPAWFGRCPSCNEWNTAIAFVTESDREDSTSTYQFEAKPLSEIDSDESLRMNTGIEELNRSLGGGIVSGSAILVSGEPGIGKSTLMLQLSDLVAGEKPVLYISGEESVRQLRLRAERLRLSNKERIEVVSANEIDSLKVSGIDKYSMVVVDSLQTIRMSSVPSLPGSVVQVRECANLLVSLAKSSDIPFLMVSHITKGGQIAGPKLVEHLVDTVLYFESSKTGYRFLRTVKNRFGPSDEIAVFEMTSEGLREVSDISSLFVEDYTSAPGNVVSVIYEGSRAFLIEVQALVSKPVYGTPRRLASGVPLERLLLVTAVLTKRAGIPLDSLDLYLNVAGGLQIEDTGVDLAIAAALVSSYTDTSIPEGIAFFGEIGLDGTVRSVSSTEKRVERAKKSSFSRIAAPEGRNGIKDVKQLLKIIGGMKSGKE